MALLRISSISFNTEKQNITFKNDSILLPTTFCQRREKHLDVSGVKPRVSSTASRHSVDYIMALKLYNLLFGVNMKGVFKFFNEMG